MGPEELGQAWGIRPVLFSLGQLNIESYPFFVLLALVAGMATYFFRNRGNLLESEKTYLIAIGALFGGVFGAKLPVWIMNWREILESFPNLYLLIPGRTILGGMLGGVVGVNFVRKRLGIKERKGNIFVVPACVGLAVGRIGCLLRGCCFGKATGMSWGIDFGDHILRHPTQLYEIVFALLFLLYALKAEKKALPGELFQNFIIAFFSFRFFEEFLRESPVYALGFTSYQIVSIFVVAYYLIRFKFILKNYGNRKTERLAN